MPRDNTHPHSDLPDLSNEDVAILYEIINISSQDPDIQTLPFRAIFAAYDEILAKYGVSSAHDQLYLRFLFRLGERLGQDEYGQERDLFTEFEGLLLELGIKIELGSAEGSVLADELSVYNDRAYDESQEGTGAFTDAETTGHPQSRQRRSRRASFSEVLDIAEETSRAGRERPESPASISRLQDTSNGFGSRPYTRRRQRRASDDSMPASVVSHPVRQKLVERQEEAQKQRSTRHREIRNEPRALAISSQRNPRHRQQLDERSISFNIYEDFAIDSLPAARSSTHDKREFERERREHLKVSQARLQRDAEMFDLFRRQNLSRTLLGKWVGLLLRKETRRAQMMLLAIQYDQQELLKQAWTEWRDKFQEKKLLAEARRRDELQKQEAAEQAKHLAAERAKYLQRRQENVEKARDAYLLSKAFSHWANCTSERVEENFVARRRLIQLRVFNAWREITNANDLKIKQTILHKFFKRWKDRSQHHIWQQDQAIALYQSTLQRDAYAYWFRYYCERRAAAWREQSLKDRYLLQWTAAVHGRAEQVLLAASCRRHRLQRQYFHKWLAKVRQTKDLERKAEQFRNRTLIAGRWYCWIRAAVLRPVFRQVSNMVDQRVAGLTFNALSQRYVEAQQARQFDRRRLLRNAWTIWNDELRVKSMQQQINDRLSMQALYKWVLAERGMLMRRVHDERMKQQALHEMFRQVIRIQIRRSEDERLATEFSKMSMLKTVLRKWTVKHLEYQAREKQAMSLAIRSATSRYMHIWHTAHEHQTQISRWSIEAAFYLRGKRSIKKWQAATKESQKQKRREAYAVVKRTYNTNLAASAFQQWKQQANRLQQLEIREHDFQVSRAERLLLDVLRHWSHRTENVNDLVSQAISYDTEKLTSTTLTLWIIRHRTVETNTATASTFYSTRIQKTAYESLRRLQLKALESRSHQEKASSILLWNSRRRARGLLRAWAERAVSRLSISNESTVQQSPDSGPLLQPGKSLVSLARTPLTNRRVQNMASFEQLMIPELAPQTPFHAFPSPLPTYLSTPSHRAARAKAMSGNPVSAESTNVDTPQRQTPAPQHRSQSFTPPTVAVAEPATTQTYRNLRFAPNHTVMESPLRIPAPGRTYPAPKALAQDLDVGQVERSVMTAPKGISMRFANTDILPQRRAQLQRQRPGQGQERIEDANYISRSRTPGDGSSKTEYGSASLDAGSGAGATGRGGGAGVRRSLFSKSSMAERARYI